MSVEFQEFYTFWREEMAKKKSVRKKAMSVNSTIQKIRDLVRADGDLDILDELDNLEQMIDEGAAQKPICVDCNGGCKCISCEGTGKCPDCNGTGNCSYCSGKGFE